jgi:hypothetical protein
MGVGGQRQASTTLLPGKRPSTHCMGGWVGPRAGVWKISPPPGVDPRTIQPVASRYTDYDIPVHSLSKFWHIIYNETQAFVVAQKVQL